MKLVAALLCVFALIALTTGQASTSDNLADFLQIMRLTSKPRKLDRNKDFAELFTEAKLHRAMARSDKFARPVLQFSWSNCGSSSDIAQVKSLSLSPDPLKLPGQVTLSANVVLSQDIGNTNAPISVSLDVQKKILFWIHIPCVDNFGSCTYNNACSLDPYNNSTSCPAAFIKNKVPCKCPFTKGAYNIANLAIDAKLPSNVPSWLSSGDYKINAKINSGQQQVACVNIEASLA